MGLILACCCVYALGMLLAAWVHFFDKPPRPPKDWGMVPPAPRRPKKPPKAARAKKPPKSRKGARPSLDDLFK